MQAEVDNAVDCAKDVLRRSRIRELGKLAVERVAEGIALHGYASSFYHKQLAQELVRTKLKGESLLNHIQVAHPLPHKPR